MVESGDERLQAKVLEYKFRHFAKPFITWYHQRWYILKQYYTVAIVLTACFLPVRLVFYTYVTHNWIGNLGMLSLIALILFILVEKNKLGKFGIYFKNRVRRLVFHKIFWVAVAGICVNIIVYGTALTMVDLGETHYIDERNAIMAMIVYGFTENDDLDTTSLPFSQISRNPIGVITNGNEDWKGVTMIESMQQMDVYPPDEIMIWWGSMNSTQRTDYYERLVTENEFEFTIIFLSIVAHLINQNFNTWLSHFGTVFFLEEIEALALLFLYRKIYFKKGGYTWQELGFQEKELKQFISRNKNHIQIQRLKMWIKGFG